MKKGIKNLAIATMVGVAATGLLTGCKLNEPKPYIQVSGFDTGYMIGEEINLDGAKILYYSDKNDTTADEIKLTESMVANFNTETEGEKKMKVFFNGCELEIDYSVISTTEFINLYNTAFDNLMNAENVHGELHMTLGTQEMKIYSNVKNNKYYSKMEFGDEIEQEWIEQYNNEWFDYLIEDTTEGMKYRIYNVSEEILNGKVMERAITNFIGQSTKLNEEAISNARISVDLDSDTLILIVKFGGSDESNEIKFMINEQKFIGVEMVERYSEGEGTLHYSSTISYNAEDVEMVDLPGNIEWEVEE